MVITNTWPANALTRNFISSIQVYEGWEPVAMIRLLNVTNAANYMTTKETSEEERRPYHEWCEQNLMGKFVIDDIFPHIFFQRLDDAAVFKLRFADDVQ